MFLALLLGLLWAPGPARAGRLTTRIVRVIDGDTVVTADKATLRLAGIDCPEMRAKGQLGRLLARKAKARMERLVNGRLVELEMAEERRDRYGRLLVYIYLQGRLINLDMIEEGLARVFIVGPNTRHGPDLIQAELRAKRAKKGLWKNWRGNWAR